MDNAEPDEATFFFKYCWCYNFTAAKIRKVIGQWTISSEPNDACSKMLEILFIALGCLDGQICLKVWQL